MNLMPMLAKELKELARSYKLLFVPLLFALLGVSQPITTYLLPTLLENLSGMPEGSVIEIPPSPPGLVLVQTIEQFHQLGILILILVAMGSIAGERASGVAATVLTKPVGRGAYLIAKAIAFSLLGLLSLTAGMALSAYYTDLLIGPVDWGQALAGSLLYLPSLLLAVAVAICFSAFMPSPVAAGGTAVVTVILINTVPRFMGEFLRSVYPGALKAASAATFMGQEVSVGRSLTGSLLVIAAFLLGGWFALEKQEI